VSQDKLGDDIPRRARESMFFNSLDLQASHFFFCVAPGDLSRFNLFYRIPV